jgi:predicted RNA-binding Zn ribbon-like protein
MTESEARWVWYGGRRSLDLVNTRRNREADPVEYLCHPADLADWLRAAGLVTGPREAVSDSLLADAIGLREAVDAGVRAAVTGTAFPSAALRELNGWLAAVPARPPQLRLAGRVAVLGLPPCPLRQVLSDIARDAAEVLGTSLRERLRICPGPGCGGRFADDSPAGRRRWCSMAVCGNRSKAAVHRLAVRGR